MSIRIILTANETQIAVPRKGIYWNTSIHKGKHFPWGDYFKTINKNHFEKYSWENIKISLWSATFCLGNILFSIQYQSPTVTLNEENKILKYWLLNLSIFSFLYCVITTITNTLIIKVVCMFCWFNRMLIFNCRIWFLIWPNG